MNVYRLTFSKSNHLLCFWHITTMFWSIAKSISSSKKHETHSFLSEKRLCMRRLSVSIENCEISLWIAIIFLILTASIICMTFTSWVIVVDLLIVILIKCFILILRWRRVTKIFMRFWSNSWVNRLTISKR
jgi:hypothetical protein